ncbi:MAG: caspase family protein [Devosia sp.]
MKLAILAAMALCLQAGAALADKRVALVVGNGAYATLGTLANPTNDADDIASTLRAIGFEVTLAEDADEHQFTDALSNFATAADGADVALFYYSGHGLQYASENYLVPVDALLRNRFSLTHETIALNDVLSAMSGAHTALVYVDACRSFPITGTFLAAANERVTPVAGLAPIEQVRNVFVGFSASPGQTARDGSGRNSPFTTAMLDKLPRPGLDVASMFSAVTAEVVSATEGAQKPQSFSGIGADVTLVAGAAPGTDSAAPDAEERAYRDATAIGTIGAYRAFVARFRGGFYAELAREALGKLEAAAGQPPASDETSAPEVAAPATSLSPGLKEANFSFFGTGKEKVGSWTISQSNGRCHMYTEAVGVSPAKWLEFRPWANFSVPKGGSVVFHSLFKANRADGTDLLAKGTTVATVTGEDGTSQAVPAMFQKGELAMLSPCDSGDGLCIDSGGVDALIGGHTLTISGKTAGGTDASVSYDITGYADAARRVDALCKAKVEFLFGGALAQTPAPAKPKAVAPVEAPTDPKAVSLVGTWALRFDCPIIDFGTTMVITAATRTRLAGTDTSPTGSSSFVGGSFDGRAFSIHDRYGHPGKEHDQTWSGSISADGSTIRGSLLGDDINTTGGCSFTGNRQ